jgi:hypothetical protein
MFTPNNKKLFSKKLLNSNHKFLSSSEDSENDAHEQHNGRNQRNAHENDGSDGENHTVNTSNEDILDARLTNITQLIQHQQDQGELTELEKEEIDSMIDTVANNLSALNTTAQTKLYYLDKDLQASKETIDSLQRALKSAEERNLQLSNEKEIAEEQFKQANSISQSQLQATIDEIKGKNVELTQQLNEAKSAPSLQAQYDQLQHDYDDVHANLQQQQKERAEDKLLLAQQQQTLAEIRQENLHLQYLVTKLNNEKDSIRNEMKQVELKNVEQQNQFQSLKQQLLDYENQLNSSELNKQQQQNIKKSNDRSSQNLTSQEPMNSLDQLESKSLDHNKSMQHYQQQFDSQQHEIERLNALILQQHRKSVNSAAYSAIQSATIEQLLLDNINTKKQFQSLNELNCVDE